MADITAADFAPDAVEAPKGETPALRDKKRLTLEDDAERLGLDEDVISCLTSLADKAELEDRQVREQLLRDAKMHHDYFRGFQDGFWDESIGDWRVPSSADLEAIGADDESLGMIINITRAHGEALISAMGSNPPSSKFFPDDAEVDDDIVTARAYTALEKLIYKQNDSSLLFYRSLFLLFNEGIIFAHTYSEQSADYGTATVKVSKPATVYSSNTTCPNCGATDLHQSSPVAKPAVQEPQQEENDDLDNEKDTEDAPSQEDAPSEEDQESSEDSREEDLGEAPKQEQPEKNPLLSPEAQTPPQTGGYQVPSVPCAACASKGINSPMEAVGDIFEEEIEVEADDEVDKTRQCINIYGFLAVKIALYSKCLKDTPYLRLAFEENVALTQEKFPDIFDRIVPSGGLSGALSYERWARTDSQYLGNIPPELGTTRVYWFRPWYYNTLGNPADDTQAGLKELKEKFPKGCKVTIVSGNMIAEVVDEQLDEHWTVSVDPLCNSLHADAIVKPLIPLQDVKNDVFVLSVDTIEHGITETFVDSGVLDFDKYKQERAQPGMKYPVKPIPGKNISESFYQDKSATLSEEVNNFNEGIDSESQFVLGSFPSIYGGNQEGGSKTLGEYSMSRAQALQRLGITWKKVAVFFCEISKLAVPSLAKKLKENGYDEKLVESQGTSFINVWIKVSELKGKIGEVTSEASEQLPVTWAQRRELLLQLMNMASQSQEIMTVLAHPQNTPVIRDALGLDELYIPGEDDRDKQYAEFVILLEGKPTMGQNGMQIPTVPVNPYDDNQVEFATCRSWVSSPTGLAYKQLNPDGFDNIVAHMNAHQAALQQQVQANLPGSPQGQKPESTGKSGVE